MNKLLLIALLIVGCAPIPTNTLNKESPWKKRYKEEDKEGYRRQVAYIDSLRKSNSIPLVLINAKLSGPPETATAKLSFKINEFSNFL